MKRKICFLLVVALCVVCASVAGYKIYGILAEYRSGEQTYDSIQQFAVIPTTVPAELTVPEKTTRPPDDTTEPAAEKDENTVLFPVVDFDGLKQINDDVVAWICIEGTRINYPVVQGEDNKEYLDTMIDGRGNIAGSIFMDYRNRLDLTNRNTILYGHNMNNGSMFADIANYRTQEYYDAHPYILLMTPEGNYRYEIVAGYVAERNESAWQLEFSTDEDAMAWIRDGISRSGFASDTIPEPGDAFLTLSTCSYEFNNARFVLVAVKK